MNGRSGHLNQEQLIDAVIDEEGLKEEQRRHLEGCPLCGEAKAAHMSELYRLGQLAADFTPAPQKRPFIPVRESRLLSFRRMAFAAGFTAVILAALIWGPALISDPGTHEVVEFAGEEEMNLFLVEDILEESALPEHYLDMAASSHSYLDEEFMELLIPSGEYDDAV